MHCSGIFAHIAVVFAENSRPGVIINGATDIPADFGDVLCPAIVSRRLG